MVSSWHLSLLRRIPVGREFWDRWTTRRMSQFKSPICLPTTTRMFKRWRNDPDTAVSGLKNWLKGDLMRVPYTNAEFLRTLVVANVERLRAKGAKERLVVPDAKFA